jgi:hypothetical protein
MSVKYAWIAKHKARWPVTLACEVLGVSASGYFEHWRRKDAGKPSQPGASRRVSDEALLVHIKAIHVQVKQEYGWPKMWKAGARSTCTSPPSFRSRHCTTRSLRADMSLSMTTMWLTAAGKQCKISAPQDASVRPWSKLTGWESIGKRHESDEAGKLAKS